MFASIIVFIIVFIIGLIISVVKINEKNAERGLDTLITTTGISFIAYSFPDVWSYLFAIVTVLKDKEQLSNPFLETNYYTLVIGIIFIIVGIFLHCKFKNKLCILNINGYKKYSIDEYVNTKKDIYSYKEREINFIYLYNILFKKRQNKEELGCILNQIEENTKSFKSETNGIKKGYTGIAPIPFIVYAGTFLDRFNIDKYFELNKKTAKYYELSNKKAEYIKLINETELNSLDKEKKNITLIIGITQEITDDDIKQFNDTNIVRLGIAEKKDNAINSIEQLADYTNTIFSTIIKLESFELNISRINLVISSQSCLALEIGKKCVDDTRLPEIVSYQYERQVDKRYPWGIVVNGKNKGKLVKEESDV